MEVFVLLEKVSKMGIRSFLSVFQRKRRNKLEIFKLGGEFAHGINILLNVGNLDRWSQLVSGSCDSELFNEVSRQKSKIKTVWDIGGHFGYTSLVFANILGKHTNIYSFEPNKYNLERFKRNLALNPHLSERIHVVPFAVSNIQGQEAFSISDNVDGSQSSGSHLARASKPLHQSVYDKFHFINTTVEVSTIDHLVKSYPKPDLIKIDVEGAEIFVLKGGVSLLKEFSPTLLIEVHNISIMHEMIHLLRDLSYDSELMETEETSLSRCFIVAKRNP